MSDNQTKKVPAKDRLLSMQHLNGDILCAAAALTTGPDPWFHELVELSLLPLDAKLKPYTFPFTVYLKPDHLERKAKKLSGERVIKWRTDRVEALDALESWSDRIGLRFNKYGNKRNRIVLVGYDLQAWYGHFIRWLGLETYEYLISPDHRDIKIAANYLNDRAAMRAEKVPYSKRIMTWLAEQHKVDHTMSDKDVIIDAKIIGQTYREMTMHGGLFG